MTTRLQLVEQAIRFENPSRIPLWFVNCDQTDGDVMVYHLSIQKPDGSGDNEWGYHLTSLGDGTMGHPTHPYIADWKSFANFSQPSVNEELRMKRFPKFVAEAEDRYLLASLDLSGFTVYTLIRGFENSMRDFLIEQENFTKLMDMIVDFELQMAVLAKKYGFHGLHFADDWATQTGMMISPKLWRKLFKPYYKKQFDFIHSLGMHVWYHCCGNFTDIIDDFHEIGVDVLNISQPNVVDVNGIGNRLRGKQCFLIPISYQTVSISGTVEEIHQEAKRLYQHLGTSNGGFIGYIEEYSCMGMSQENYYACADAFRELMK